MTLTLWFQGSTEEDRALHEGLVGDFMAVETSGRAQGRIFVKVALGSPLGAFLAYCRGNQIPVEKEVGR